MANWTVTESSTALAQGATVSANVVLTILPLTGFVVSASNFKIGEATNTSGNIWAGGNVDSSITTVTFADTTTAGAVGNTVTATVAFTSFDMPGNLKQLYIDIDEIAEVENLDRFFCVRTQHLAETDSKGINKHIVTYASAPTGITTANNTPLLHNNGDGLVEHLHQGIVAQGPAAPGELILSVDFDANELFGYHYISEPTFSTVTGAYSSYYTFINSDHVYDTDGNLIFVTIKGYYTPPVGVTGLDPDPAGSASAMCELGQSVLATHVIRQTPQGEPGSTTRVTNVDIDSSAISRNGEVRIVKILGDAFAQFTFKIVSSDSSKTYDFGPVGDGVNGIFTAGATESDPSTIGTNLGTIDSPIHFPAVTSTTYYDIIVTPTTPTTATPNVPTAANQLRIYQYPTIDISLGLLDGGSVYDDSELLDGDPNVAAKITGPGGVNATLSRDFSYTITEAMVTSGSTNTLAVKAALDFTLDNSGSSIVKLDGDASGTSFDIDSTTGIIAGATINWSVQKNPVFNVEKSSIVSVAAHDAEGDTSNVPNNDNLVVGMEVTGSTVRSSGGIPVTVVSVGSQEVNLSEQIEATVGIPLTFTAAGVTVSSVTDANTLVASQTMAGVKDNFALTFGGQGPDLRAGILSPTVTKVGDNIIIAGTFQVSSFPVANATVKLDLNELITIS